MRCVSVSVSAYCAAVMAGQSKASTQFSFSPGGSWAPGPADLSICFLPGMARRAGTAQVDGY